MSTGRAISPRRRSIRRYYPFLIALLFTLLTLSLVIYPKEGFRAAIDGLHVFWDIVFPSLLPFFVLSEILMGLGVVHALGVLLEPLMRPLFNVPGVGAFALSMGLAAGYPMDAVITSKFRRLGLCTKTEGERLLAFTNTADPLFILGAVAVGMFGSPKIGVILAIAHYVSSFSVGFIFRFYKRNDEPTPDKATDDKASIMRRAARALLKARRDDGRSFGKLMGESVKESMQTLVLICGYIMLFSVVVKVATLVNFTALISPLIAVVLKLFGLHPSLNDSLFRGLLEIDLGTMATAKAAGPILDKAIVASFIIAWSGLSVHAQVASVVIDSDIRMGAYVLARVLHGVLASIYTWILMVPLGSFFAETSEVFNGISRSVASAAPNLNTLVVEKWLYGSAGVVMFTGILLGSSFVVNSSNRIKSFISRALR